MSRCTALGLFALLSAGAAAAQVGTVTRSVKIGAASGPLGAALDDHDLFGQALAALGDLDGDGLPELAVGAPDDDDGGNGRGAVYVLFLGPDASVRAWRKLGNGSGSFPAAIRPDLARFGYALAPLGDVDGDGIPDLAIGAPQAATVWTCLMRPDGSVRVAREIGPAHPIFGGQLPVTHFFGETLTTLGDVDRNGIADLAVLVPGSMVTRFGSELWRIGLDAQASPNVIQRVASTFGGGTGPLANHHFGRGGAAAFDADGNGDVDLLTPGGPWAGSPARVLLLDLDARLAVVGLDELTTLDLATYWGIESATAGGISALHFVPDLDGDGAAELVVGLRNWQADASAHPKGALVIAFLRAHTTQPRGFVLIGPRRGGLDAHVPARSGFGSSVAFLGDLDGDGDPELAVGASTDGEVGAGRGAVWILSLDGSPSRNGSGVNPVNLTQATPPVMSRTWTLALDCSAHAPGAAFVTGSAGRHAGLRTALGELLLEPGRPPLFRAVLAHPGGVATYSAPVPTHAALYSLAVSVQGLCDGVPGPRLGNAIDERVSLP